MNVLERATGASLRVLNRVAGSEWLERMGLSGHARNVVYHGTKLGAQAAQEAAKRAMPMVKLVTPERMVGGDRAPAVFDLTPTESQALIVETMARFARERLYDVALESDESNGPAGGLLAESHELGLTQLAVPEALGGAGEARSPMTNVLVAEALARGDAGLALAMLSPVAVVNALVDFGTSEQQGRWLPMFVGETFVPAALAIAEPRTTTDPMDLATRATALPDGYVLDGTKTCVPLAADAEILLVAASLGGAPAVFLVERGAAGLSVEADPTMGLRSAKLGRVKLEGVKVPRDARLGGDAGLDYERLIDLSRIAWCALAVGTGQAVLDYVKDYCNDRIAFGEPVSNRQSVAFMIADIAIELEGMRLLTYRAAARATEGQSFHREAYLARVQCVEKGMRIGTDGVQLLGGHGFIKDHPIELWYRHLRGIGIFEGALVA